MENVTFQQRIEQKAKNRLFNDLADASEKLKNVGRLIDYDFDKLLDVYKHHGYSSKAAYVIKSGQEIFDKLLPKYVSQVTDEILQKVDEIDWLVSERNNQEQDY